MKSKSKKRRASKKTVRVPAIVLVVFVIIVVLAWCLHVINDKQTANVGRLVTIYDRGQQHVILTHANTVREALKSANITVTPEDGVEPAVDSKLLVSDSAVIIYRARTVLVVDGSLRQKVVTAAAAPTEIAKAAGIDKLGNKDKTTFTTGSIIADGASIVMTVKRSALTPGKVIYVPKPNALTKSRGAQLYTDAAGVTHRETYYDLPMNIVIGSCGGGGYTIRAADGAKVDKNGYILVAANYNIYPRCSIVETSMGPGKVYDTGGFALRYPHGFDLATDWSNSDGR